MTRALIAFATRHGQTERIALRIAKVLADGGVTADIVDLRRGGPALNPGDYELIVLAGGIYFGRHPRALERLIGRNRAALEAADAVLVSVSGAAISADGLKEAEGYVTALSRRTGWTPRRSLLAGGAIRFTQYNFLLRWMMKRIAATHGRGTDTTRDYEYTYWPEVEEFAHALLVAPQPAPSLRSGATISR